MSLDSWYNSENTLKNGQFLILTCLLMSMAFSAGITCEKFNHRFQYEQGYVEGQKNPIHKTVAKLDGWGGYTYRQNLTISLDVNEGIGTSNGNTVYLNNHGSWDDIVFADKYGNILEQPYPPEYDGKSAKFWITLPELNQTDNVVFMYYSHFNDTITTNWSMVDNFS